MYFNDKVINVKYRTMHYISAFVMLVLRILFNIQKLINEYLISISYSLIDNEGNQWLHFQSQLTNIINIIP